jgi:hypothetical protein
MELMFKKVSESLKSLEAGLRRVKEHRRGEGVAVSLEIKPEAFPISASGHAADKSG